ncbi:hypothetical protein LCGC14_0397060 [marine sediment metagenome]|uniref:Uncharacterized protein n=1 Tax=marine sediment metagenome TaxID=412755 RepID=A0A0F9W6T9_9ZZZZ
MSDKPVITAEMIRESLKRQPELVAMMKRLDGRSLADDPAAVERAAYEWLGQEGLHRESEFETDADWEEFLVSVQAVLRAAETGDTE